MKKTKMVYTELQLKKEWQEIKDTIKSQRDMNLFQKQFPNGFVSFVILRVRNGETLGMIKESIDKTKTAARHKN